MEDRYSFPRTTWAVSYTHLAEGVTIDTPANHDQLMLLKHGSACFHIVLPPFLEETNQHTDNGDGDQNQYDF